METLTNHEDPVFILDLIIFLFALVFFESQSGQKSALLIFLFPLLMGFFSGQRRAVYAAIVPAFVCLFTLSPAKARQSLLYVGAPLLLFAAVYCAIFWNNEGKLASPVRLVKSGLFQNREDAGERYNSDLYRKIEKFDLAQNVKEAPMIGLGFGKKYQMPVPLVPIAFPLRDYIPHDEILWVLVKMGAIGFFLFWVFVDAFAVQGASIVARIKDPYLKSVGVTAICAIIIQIVVSNFDLQLTYYRNMVFLGTMMGLVSSLSSIDHPKLGRRHAASRSDV